MKSEISSHSPKLWSRPHLCSSTAGLLAGRTSACARSSRSLLASGANRSGERPAWPIRGRAEGCCLRCQPARPWPNPKTFLYPKQRRRRVSFSLWYNWKCDMKDTTVNLLCHNTAHFIHAIFAFVKISKYLQNISLASRWERQCSLIVKTNAHSDMNCLSDKQGTIIHLSFLLAEF